MKNLSLVIIGIVALYFLLTPQSFAQEKKVFKFVGVSVCAPCHKTDKQGKQLDIWEKSAHSKAYETLKSEAADKIAAEKGLTTKAVDSPECLKCHASGYNVDKELLGEKFKVEQGVQCETCHGPGSEYKAMSVMKDRAKSIENGLVFHEDKEKFCTGCHNPESPTYKEFKFEEMWKKISHMKPKATE
ncbi:MAG: cytochrome c family protein [Ignavibacteria bacterium]|nr:cytochrome c family protein [Ignavibacteria bacterium]